MGYACNVRRQYHIRSSSVGGTWRNWSHIWNLFLCKKYISNQNISIHLFIKFYIAHHQLLRSKSNYQLPLTVMDFILLWHYTTFLTCCGGGGGGGRCNDNIVADDFTESPPLHKSYSMNWFVEGTYAMRNHIPSFLSDTHRGLATKYGSC